ncbi:MAG: 30S ribosome-binding factor RbfA [Pseudomonadota bacterium]
MPGHRGYNRVDRIADQMQRELAELISYQLKDPRLGMVTITGVEVSRELDHAKVFVTLMTDAEDAKQQAVAILNKAAGFLRKELGRSMRLRTIPQLHFAYDTSIDQGVRLSALIDAAVAKDKKGHTTDESEG